MHNINTNKNFNKKIIKYIISNSKTQFKIYLFILKTKLNLK